jgi:hypothetical protein
MAPEAVALDPEDELLAPHPAVVELLDALDALQVDVGRADDVRGEAPLWIAPASLADLADSFEPERRDPLGDLFAHPAGDPHEAAVLREVRGEPLGRDRERLCERRAIGGVERMLARAREDRRHRDGGREDDSGAVEDLAARLDGSDPLDVLPLRAGRELAAIEDRELADPEHHDGKGQEQAARDDQDARPHRSTTSCPGAGGAIPRRSRAARSTSAGVVAVAYSARSACRSRASCWRTIRARESS